MTMSKHALVISIRPRFAEMIFDGSKTVELRRVCPIISEGDLALVYVSSPAKELQGAFEVGEVISTSPSALWRKIGKKSRITRKEFFAYFHGKKKAHALVIKRTWKLSAPICLSTLRRRKGGFRPPQNFHYLKRNESSQLTSLLVLQNN
jgi:predicted transcriptional regulator